jgi:uncharacterized protein (DUF1697 family)
MTRYVVFLRGVNVGGHNLVKTSDICKRLASLGFADVRGYKQSGNILFETADADSARITAGIRRELQGLLGKDIDVFLRTMPQVREMVRFDPFRNVEPGDVKMFVTFLAGELPETPLLPLRSPAGDAEVILVRDREAYGLGYLKDGRYGASYGHIEAKFGMAVTTRNWNTIKGIAALPGP